MLADRYTDPACMPRERCLEWLGGWGRDCNICVHDTISRQSRLDTICCARYIL